MVYNAYQRTCTYMHMWSKVPATIQFMVARLTYIHKSMLLVSTVRKWPHNLCVEISAELAVLYRRKGMSSVTIAEKVNVDKTMIMHFTLELTGIMR